MKRAGGEALCILAAPLNVHILAALEEGPKELIDLRRAAGSPPQSTMRVYTRTLIEANVLERRRQNEFPGSVRYAITSAGEALVRVAEVVQGWLRSAPEGPVLLGSPAAKSSLRALVEGWDSNIVRALAARPLSLTELNRLIPKISYPSLERRLGALRLARLVEPQPGDGRGTPYRATEWLRRSIVPAATAAGWERRYTPDTTTPIGRLDVEAAFLLAAPLLDLPSDLSGRCRLVVEIQGGSNPIFAGALIQIEDGKVLSCTSRLDGEVESWASGPPRDWLRQLEGQGEEELEMGGDASLAAAVVDALNGSASAFV
jgi:DNA-binding HxlR family transcriptional regulator